MSWTREQLDSVLKKRAKPTVVKSKYRNQRVVIDGEKFDSKREAAYYQELKLREKAGEVRNIQRQMTFHLCCPQMDETFKQPDSPVVHYVADYIADFTFEESFADIQVDGRGRPLPSFYVWRKVVVDVKGAKNTQIFALKKKWLFLQHGIDVREVR